MGPTSNIERGLGNFFRLHLSKNREAPLVKISLRHAAPGSKGQDVESFDIASVIEADNIESMVNEILQRAQEDADGLGGLQRYVIHLYEKSTTKASARYMFRLRGMEDEYDESGGEESPTMKGLLTQLMRHNEANVRTMTVGFGGVMNHLVRRLESSDNMVEKLMKQRQIDFTNLEQAMSTQHDRDMQLLLTEGSEKRKDEMFAKLSILVPVVINKLAGQKVLDTKDPAAMMLKEFVGSLNEEQYRSILGSLKPEQAISLLSIVKSLKAGDEKSSNGTES